MPKFVSYAEAARAWASGRFIVWLCESCDDSPSVGLSREARRNWRKARNLREAARRFAYHVSIEGDAANFVYAITPNGSP